MGEQEIGGDQDQGHDDGTKGNHDDQRLSDIRLRDQSIQDVTTGDISCIEGFVRIAVLPS